VIGSSLFSCVLGDGQLPDMDPIAAKQEGLPMKSIRTSAVLGAATIVIILIAGCGDDPVTPETTPPGPYARFTLELNSDVVVNNRAGGIDNTQEAVDDSLQGAATNYAYATQSAMETINPALADGLPDDGFFPASDFHPDVQLSFSNDKNGRNARRILTNGESYTFSTGAEHLSDFHIFVAAGQGDVAITIEFTYSSFGKVFSVIVPDWFNEVTETEARYYLIDGMDRMRRNATSFENRDDATIFGLHFAGEPADPLERVTITRNSTNNAANSVLVVFGAMGVRATGSGEDPK
jgi:hypothetical protein